VSRAFAFCIELIKRSNPKASCIYALIYVSEKS
jgi:hypothetical protein